MRKARIGLIGLLLLVVILLISVCASCFGGAQEISTSQFEQRYLEYKTAIQNVDSTLKVDASPHIYQNGDHIAVYSVETAEQSSFYITVTFYSSSSAKIEIEFFEAEENWNDYNRNLLCTFISRFTDSGISYDEIVKAVDTVRNSPDGIRLDSRSFLDWDSDWQILHYETKTDK